MARHRQDHAFEWPDAAYPLPRLLSRPQRRIGAGPGDSLRGDEAVEAAKRAFRVPPSFDYEFVYDEDAHANATVYVDPVAGGGE